MGHLVCLGYVRKHDGSFQPNSMFAGSQITYGGTFFKALRRASIYRGTSFLFLHFEGKWHSFSFLHTLVGIPYLASMTVRHNVCQIQVHYLLSGPYSVPLGEGRGWRKHISGILHYLSSKDREMVASLNFYNKIILCGFSIPFQHINEEELQTKIIYTR